MWLPDDQAVISYQLGRLSGPALGPVGLSAESLLLSWSP